MSSSQTQAPQQQQQPQAPQQQQQQPQTQPQQQQQTATSASSGTVNKQIEPEKIYQWINELCMPATREEALIELSRQREAVQDLAPMLWHSFGAIAALLQEVISVYPAINPPNLTVRNLIIFYCWF